MCLGVRATPPQTIEVIQTRAADPWAWKCAWQSRRRMEGCLGRRLLRRPGQYPASSGWLADWRTDAAIIHAKGRAPDLAPTCWR